MRRLLPLALLLVPALPVASASAQNPWLEKRVLNIAHQGGEDESPSNTLYAFKKSVKAGADMLELDVGITKDDRIVVSHDTTLDRTTNGRGTIESRSLRQIRRLDAAYWFAKGRDDAYARDRPKRAFPRTPINIEIKGRTKAEETAEYLRNAEVLAAALDGTSRRDLIVVSFV